MLTQEDDVEIHALHARGWSLSAISRHTGRDRKTVAKYVKAGPANGPRRERAASCLEPFRGYIAARFVDDPAAVLRHGARSSESSSNRDPATEWTEATVRRYAKTETVMLHSIDCLWGPLGAETAVRVILVQDTARTCGYQIALITTHLSSTPTQIVERWPIEVCYEEAKHIFGVGQARNRGPRAVQRTAPFQFLAMTLTILWYALHGHHPDVVAEHRARAPWYATKTNPSTADMLAKLRRTIIAAQYHPGPGHTHTTAQITSRPTLLDRRQPLN